MINRLGEFVAVIPPVVDIISFVVPLLTWVSEVIGTYGWLFMLVNLHCVLLHCNRRNRLFNLGCQLQLFDDGGILFVCLLLMRSASALV